MDILGNDSSSPEPSVCEAAALSLVDMSAPAVPTSENLIDPFIKDREAFREDGNITNRDEPEHQLLTDELFVSMRYKITPRTWFSRSR